ncbi:hypothetical protein IQ07DRAFT_637092 [Pyrenochaeta sp. DS3sAY3a]|nr:hypothetical protein IQ07DRAFT_637092 [Pyrenochaeta sp. DS3sAY3a]
MDLAKSAVVNIRIVFSSVLLIAELLESSVFRPFRLFQLYGASGLFLFVFGSRTTWRTQAYVLGKVDDDDALNFKKSVHDECTMISVAPSPLDCASFLPVQCGICPHSRVLCDDSATNYGKTPPAAQVRGWIRGRLPPRGKSVFKSRHIQQRTDPSDYRSTLPDLNHTIADVTKACFTPCVSSVITVSAPQMLLSTSLVSLLLGIGVYFGFIWTRNLDTDAWPNESRNVLIVYLVSVIVCSLVYSISRFIQDDDTRTEGSTLRNYVKEYIKHHPDVVNEWLSNSDENQRTAESPVGHTEA